MQRTTDNLDELLAVIPSDIRVGLERMTNLSLLREVVLDLGRPPEARFSETFDYLRPDPVTETDLEFVAHRVGEFGGDNRAGIERTLHRISAIRNRRGKIVGLTCRVGRAVYGTIDIIRDVVESGKSVLLLGRPGVGKTTKLREVARVLADELRRRVIVVDTSNEIAGDGDIAHPGIGTARRMQVAHPSHQHDVMIEAVENHMPQVVIIDEIGREAEAEAARTIAERGVQLIATAHGNTLENLVQNPTLCDLIGGIQAVTLGDEEARRRATQKTVLERKAPPTFDVVIELLERDRLAVHHNVADTVDAMLRGIPPRPEIRARREDGSVEVSLAAPVIEGVGENRRVERPTGGRQQPPRPEQLKRLFPFGVSRNRLQRAIRQLGLDVTIAHSLAEADAVLILKAHHRRDSPTLRDAVTRRLPVFVMTSNTYAQIASGLSEIFATRTPQVSPSEQALHEAERAVRDVLATAQPIELKPQSALVRRQQHQIAHGFNLRTHSVGKDPFRRVRILPA